MKKIVTLVVLTSLMAVFALSSCIEEREPAYLRFEKPFISLNASDTLIGVMMTYSNDWTVEPAAADWYTVAPMSGKGNKGTKLDSTRLEIKVKANTTGKIRGTDIVVKSVNIKLALPIQQEK